MTLRTVNLLVQLKVITKNNNYGRKFGVHHHVSILLLFLTNNIHTEKNSVEYIEIAFTQKQLFWNYDPKTEKLTHSV